MAEEEINLTAPAEATRTAVGGGGGNAFSRFASAIVSKVTASSVAGPPSTCATLTVESAVSNASPSTPRSSRSPSPRGNTLTVPRPPRIHLGAIPRQQHHHHHQQQQPSSSSSIEDVDVNNSERRCFCGYYSESSSPGRPTAGKKAGRCKFCRSRAKYIPGQRSFDAARIFGRRRTEPPRRAVSEDRRSDGQTEENTSCSNSSATTASSSFDRPSPAGSRPPLFSTPPFLRRQERLEVHDASPNRLQVPPYSSSSSSPQTQQPQPPSSSPQSTSPIGSTGGPLSSYYQLPVRDHGLRTPPAPPTSLPGLRSLTPSSSRRLEQQHDRSTLSHRMAHEMPEYLVPPPRSSANILGRAHTDPSSLYESEGAEGGVSPHPTSPPPAYSDVVVGAQNPNHPPQQQPSSAAPPTYEEALCSRVAEMRLHATQSGLRSLSEDRTTSTAGTTSASSGFRSSAAARARGRQQLTRSSRAEEIPDIYWEQAARELDFCTCRKCQARYRQYFEEDPDHPVGGDAMMPMETQVLMQEVLTDGMAFCALM